MNNNENNIFSDEELQKNMNAQFKDFDEWRSYMESFIFKLHSDGIIKDLDAKQLQKWMSSPENHKKYLEKITAYEYISNPSIFQLFDMLESLPYLKPQITVEDMDDNYLKCKKKCKLILKKIKHKTLTREILKQTAISGTLCGVWCGTKNKPFPYIFDDLDYIFPAYKTQEGWLVWLDMSWFDKMNDIEREVIINQLKPIVTKDDYDLYKTYPDNFRYLQLPIEKSFCITTHKIYTNQRFGIPWSTPMLFDILHKNKLKNLERSVSNKVINSVASLKIGSDTNDKFDWSKVKKKKKGIYYGVKKALEKNNDGGVSTIVAYPHWVTLDFPNIKTNGLEPEKFKSVNSDLNIASGGMLGIVSGDLNFASGKLALDIMYRKIAVLLETIEEEIYQKLFNWILPTNEENNFSLIYDKKSPLSTKEKIDILSKLNANYGFSLKAVIDCLDDIDYDQYLEDTMREQKEIKLPEKIKPYQSAHTTKDNLATKPINSNPDNDNTDISKSNGGNSNPKPTTE